MNKLFLLFLSLVFVVCFGCAGSKGSSSAYYDDDEGGGGGSGGGGSSRPAKIKEDDLNKTYDEATSLTEENHKLAREIFEAKQKLGISD